MVSIKLGDTYFQIRTLNIEYFNLGKFRNFVILQVYRIQSMLRLFSSWSIEGVVMKMRRCRSGFTSYNLLRAHCV